MKAVIIKTLLDLLKFLGLVILIAGSMFAIFAPFYNPKLFIFSGIWILVCYGGLFLFDNYTQLHNKNNKTLD